MLGFFRGARMTEKHSPIWDFSDETDAAPHQLKGSALPTETIDLSSLFAQEMYSSGTFDLTGVGSTALGNLLDALPMPALLIDQQNCVEFVNQSFSRMNPGHREIRGVPFLDFLPRPSDTARAQRLADKTLALLTGVFVTRKPRVAEAILELDHNKIWGRLYLRAVRIESERFVLMLIEDLTHEKRQIELNRRQEREFRLLRADLEARLEAYRLRLSAASEEFQRELEADHERTRYALQVAEQKCQLLADEASLAVAVIGPSGAFHEVNQRFGDMFGYTLADLPNFADWITETADSRLPGGITHNWRAEFDRTGNGSVPAEFCTVTCRDGTCKAIRLRGVKLEDDNYLLMVRPA